MAKIYGQLISAQFECLATDPANHPLARPYFNTASKTIKYYDGTSWLTIVDRVYLATVTLANPMTTMGDMIYGGASGAVTRLPAGTSNQVLISAGVAPPAWSLLADASIAAGANIDAAKLGTGAISTTVFNYLTGVTSSIQTQLNAKQATITVLPIANGGTGAITAPLAFGNLSPLSTKGDLLVFGTANTRLPASTDGFALFLDSSQALGVKWAAIPPSGYATSVITANPSPAVNNTQYLANTTSAAFTITLPAGSTGAKIKIQDDKGTWDSNNLTITPATGERIFPLAANVSLVCNVVRGWIELVWDGAGWSPNSLASTTLGSGSGLIGIQQSGAVTAVNGVMYECDTTSAGFTLTLPSGTSAAVVGILDAGPFFTTNNLIVAPATGQSIDTGAANDTITFDGNRQSCIFYRANGSSVWEIQTASQTAYAPGFTPGYTGATAISAGNIGELGGTVRSGTNGFSKSYRSSTVITQAGQDVYAGGILLNKGVYLLNHLSEIQQNSGSVKTLTWYLSIGGTQVSQTMAIDIQTAQAYIVPLSLPLQITADNTIVEIRMGFTATATSAIQTHEAFAARIA